MAKDYIVKDIGLANYGRKEISIAETARSTAPRSP